MADSAILPIIKSGNVSVTNRGIISTTSVGSAGLIAQSIAGGGGYVSQTGDNDEYQVTFGSNGNINAAAADVSVDNTAGKQRHHFLVEATDESGKPVNPDESVEVGTLSAVVRLNRGQRNKAGCADANIRKLAGVFHLLR